MSTFTAWKTDNYKFVGKAFDVAAANRMNKLAPVITEINAKSKDYELTGSGGYGEVPKYDGQNLNIGDMSRAFKTVIIPEEFSMSIPVGYKEAKIDKFGETAKVGTKLGESMALTVYLHVLRMFANAWDPKRKGGDGEAWASDKHPVASKGSSGRIFVPDKEAGTYSNKGTLELSVEGISEYQSRASRFVTPDGLPFLCDMDLVLCSPELETRCKELFGTEAKLKPDTELNNANPYNGMKYLVVGGGKDGFTGKQWALCDQKLMKQLVNLVYITRPMVFSTEQDNPLIDLYTTYADFGAGWGDARQIIFSDPA